MPNSHVWMISAGKKHSLWIIFSRDEATLYERVSVRPLVDPLVGRSVTLLLFGLLGATYGRVSGLVSMTRPYSTEGKRRPNYELIY